jgi:hypothetical protein
MEVKIKMNVVNRMLDPLKSPLKLQIMSNLVKF